MSTSLSNIEIQQFLADAHQEFQSQGNLLRDCVRKKSGKGRTFNFPVFGEGIANQKAPQDDLTPMNVQSRNVTCTTEDWFAPEYAGLEFKETLAANETQEYVQLSGKAIARRSDQLIIDVMAAANYGGGAGQGNSIAAGGTGLTYAKFRQAKKFLKAAGCFGRKFLVCDADGEEDLLGEVQLTSSDYVGQQPVQGMGMDRLSRLGVEVIVIPDMREAGLAGNVAYMFDENAIGYAETMSSMMGSVDWVPHKASYLINAFLQANACVVDATGMVEINYA